MNELSYRCYEDYTPYSLPFPSISSSQDFLFGHNMALFFWGLIEYICFHGDTLIEQKTPNRLITPSI